VTAVPPVTAWQRRRSAVAAACLTLAIVLLPGLVAGWQLEAPPAPGELERLQAALGHERGVTEVGGLFLRAAVAEASFVPADEAERAALVSRARIAQVGYLFAISGLCYVAVLLARGRVQALLSCALLAVLPPVGVEGHVLRPETAATALALLAVVLFQCVAQQAGRRPGRSRCASLWGLCLCAVFALALAVAAMPAAGHTLLVPGVVLTVSALQLGLRAFRVANRRGALRVPIRSLNGRLLPWTCGALLTPAAAWLVLTQEAEYVLPSPSEVGLLPAGSVLRWLAWAFVAVGGTAALVRVGLRFGRKGRVDVDLVLLVYCALMLAGAVGRAGTDRLAAAPAMAFVLAEAARFAVAWLANRLGR
jgi:hypothetical protein